ncbi:hypothetical protein SGPA1_60199 [Streptomyces misionensis JCM 4497]
MGIHRSRKVRRAFRDQAFRAQADEDPGRHRSVVSLRKA